MSQAYFSIEFFPPKTPEGVEKLRTERAELAALGAKYYSVTVGAGGSAMYGNNDTVAEIQKEGLEAAPHFLCIGSTRESVSKRLQEYKTQGIKHLVALRGDLQSGSDDVHGEFHYANELVAFIRQETGDWFKIDVAAYPEMHPQAKSLPDDMNNFVRKVKAGADMAITQYFYNADAYFRFVDDVRKAGVTIPIVPGIMPITNYAQLARFSSMCGAEIPRWIRLKLESYGEDLDAIRDFGLDVVAELCQRLLAGGAPGFHFYTLNRAGPTAAIWQRLSLSDKV
ncbi:MAG: methylenetetrahydrofolate reductase [NAD(P)H] [Oxalobacter sp.]|jgi:methylenetetrahydrofolate reductase (NADPH)|nr:MAG: methylenetetrahydrofolate reductase [NAD(P)H] [Oxalobacter sp.]